MTSCSAFKTYCITLFFWSAKVSFQRRPGATDVSTFIAMCDRCLSASLPGRSYSTTLYSILMGSGGSKKAAEAAKAEPKQEPVAEPTAEPKAEPKAEPTGGTEGAAAPFAPMAADGPYKIVDPEDFVVESLKLAGGVLEENADVREGKVLQVAKHPDEHMMEYWLKVEYGTAQVAFVHTLMSCGWNSSHCIRNVGDAQFPPDEKNLPVSLPSDEAEPAEGPYKIVDPEDFVVEGVKSCGGQLTGKDAIKHGKVLQVAKHPQESRMDYWLKVEYDSKIAFVHMLMSCGWTSTEVLEDVGDAAFPPEKGAELPDLKPDDYAQEFVCPEHQDAIEKDEKLKAAFPEFSDFDKNSDMKAIWRGPTGFWLEVNCKGSRYGVHYLEPEGAGPESWAINCAVKLAEDEEFPPEPRTTRGKAVAF